ncbi:MAG TPA: dipicolinate synthase subunit DpsA [Tissierellaceae bacterium]|nr:dipicolinate synthase subunit DpsA [Tissierellaceae bacterium]
MNMKITVLGGDQRSLSLANLLAEDGNKVLVYGFDEIEKNSKLIKEDNLKKAIDFSNIIIGPLPFMEIDGILNTPHYSQEIMIKDIFKKLSKDKVLLGGYIGDEYKSLALDYPFKLIDYFKREEMQVLNGIPTAEGAIQIAMEEMKTTLHGSNVLVLGFGRIGKILAKMLYGIGSNVYVETRNYSDVSWIKAYGYKPVLLKEMKEYISNIDTIFNTIPSMVLDEPMLKELNKEAIIIDLASKPGGVDLDKAKEMKINTVLAPGLPGRVAPITAALCIKETIYNIIEELEV